MSLNKIYSNDSDLIVHFKNDSIEAFKYIYESFYHPLLHYANSFTKNLNQAEDIVAESFVTLWQKRKEFETFKGLTAFLYTCTRNACITYLKKEKRHNISHLEISYLLNQATHNPGIEDLRSDLIQCSLIEASNLPPAAKKVFILSYIDGFSTSEIAEKLNLSVHTIRNQKVTAIKKVKASLIKKGLLSWLF